MRVRTPYTNSTLEAYAVCILIPFERGIVERSVVKVRGGGARLTGYPNRGFCHVFQY